MKHNFKRTLSLVLALVMALSCMSLSVWAEPVANELTVTGSVQGKYSITHSYETGYDTYSDLYKVSDGFYQDGAKYDSTSNFYITNIDGLKYFRDWVNGTSAAMNAYNDGEFLTMSLSAFATSNGMDGKTVHLLSDIDLDGEIWQPIGPQSGRVSELFHDSWKSHFYGSFYGHGHTIYNMNTSQSEQGDKYSRWPQGFFGYIASSGTVFDGINFVNANVESKVNGYAGVIVGNAASNAISIQECTISGNIYVSGGYSGAICGIGDVNIINCTVNATAGSTITGTSFAGGLIGAKRGSTALNISGNKVENVKVSTSQFGGALVGATSAGSGYSLNITDNTISYCKVNNEYVTESELIATNSSSTTAITLTNNKITPTFVAQIGSTGYDTLQHAINAAVTQSQTNNGTVTVTLLDNVTDGTGLALFNTAKGNYPAATSANIVIDFGGHTYTVAAPPVGSTGTENQALHFEAGNTVKLHNGTINMTTDGEKRSDFNMIMQNYGSLTIEDMTIDGTGIAIAKYGTFTGTYAAFSNTDKPQFNFNESGTSVIRNSTIIATGDMGIDDSANVTIEDDAVIKVRKVVTKGTDDDRYGSATPTITIENGAKFSCDVSAILADNQELSNLIEGLYTVVPESSNVAKIGTTEYATLAAAIEAVPTDGSETTITMIADETIVGNAGVTVAAGKNIVLDLNGNTIKNAVNENKASQVILNKGTLTITDSTDTASDGTGSGVITNSADENTVHVGEWWSTPQYNYTTNVITNNGTLNMVSGKLRQTASGSICYAVDNNSNGVVATLNISGGKIEDAVGTAVRMFCNSTTAENTINMTGGTITTPGKTAIWTQLPGSNSSSMKKATLNISGGTISGGEHAWYDYSFGDGWDNVNYEITGGDFKGELDSSVKTGFISGGKYSVELKAEYIADGYEAVVLEEGDNGYSEGYRYKVQAKTTYVAKIGTTEYATLAAAIAAAMESDTTQTITILDDCTSEQGFVINKSLNIDTNGKTITFTEGGANSTNSNRAFKLMNGTLHVYGGGTIDAKGTKIAGATASNANSGTGYYGAFRADVGTVLTLENLTLKNYRPWGLNVKVLGATATLDHVIINSVNGGGIEVTDDDDANNVNHTGSATLTNCEMTQTDWFDWCSVPVSVSGGSTVDVHSTSYTGSYGAYVFSSGGTINIYGGSWSSEGTHPVLMTTYDSKYGCDATINVYGGEIAGTFGIHDNGHEHLNISGGKFSVDPSYPTSYLATGYTIENIEEGPYRFKVVGDSAVFTPVTVTSNNEEVSSTTEEEVTKESDGPIAGTTTTQVFAFATATSGTDDASYAIKIDTQVKNSLSNENVDDASNGTTYQPVQTAVTNAGKVSGSLTVNTADESLTGVAEATIALAKDATEAAVKKELSTTITAKKTTGDPGAVTQTPISILGTQAAGNAFAKAAAQPGVNNEQIKKAEIEMRSTLTAYTLKDKGEGVTATSVTVNIDPYAILKDANGTKLSEQQLSDADLIAEKVEITFKQAVPFEPGTLVNVKHDKNIDGVFDLTKGDELLENLVVDENREITITTSYGTSPFTIERISETTVDSGDMANVNHITSYSLTLKAKIGVNFNLHLTDAVKDSLSSYYVTLEADGNTTQTIYASDATYDSYHNDYLFTIPIRPYTYTTPITMTLHKTDGSVLPIYNQTGSIEQENGTFVKSLSDIIAVAETIGSDGLQEFAPKIRAYCAYTVQHLDKNNDTVGGVTLGDKEDAKTGLSGYTRTEGTLPDGVTYNGTSLILGTETSIKMYFNSEAADHTISYRVKDSGADPTVLTPTVSGSECFVKIKELNIKQLNTVFEILIDDVVVETYSAFTWANAVIQKANAYQYNIATAMYYYNTVGTTYLNSIGA